MSEDMRDEPRPAGPAPGGARHDAAPEEPLATTEPPEAGEPGADPARDFAAETARAESLRGPEVPDYKDRWLRAEAELQNARRRLLREREEAVRASEDRVLLDVIGILDDLERALASLPEERAGDAWVQGVALTAQRLRDTLARHGVTPVAAVGEPFDPIVHDALLEIAAPEGVRPGHVAQEIQRGYRRGDRALRAARVVVARPGA
jgi:molecular chaperone GrpE